MPITGWLNSLIKKMMGDGFDTLSDSLKSISEKIDNIPVDAGITPVNDPQSGEIGRFTSGTEMEGITVSQLESLLNFFLKNEFISISTGIGDADKPIVLNSEGKVDPSMVDAPGVNPDEFYKVDGTNPITANFQAAGFRLINVGNPSSASDALNRGSADIRYLLLSGGILIGELILQYASPIIAVDSTDPNNNNASLDFRHNGINRFKIALIPAGDLVVARYDSGGNYMGLSMQIYSSDGSVYFPEKVIAGKEIAITSESEKFIHLGNESSSYQINVADATTFRFTNTSVSPSVTFLSPISSARTYSFTLFVRAASGINISWPGNVMWKDGQQPVVGNGVEDVFVFSTYDQGSTWNGYHAGAYS
jgi:hypothetical protein